MFGVGRAKRRADALNASLERNEVAVGHAKNRLVSSLAETLGGPASLAIAFASGCVWSAFGNRLPQNWWRHLPTAYAAVQPLFALHEVQPVAHEGQADGSRRSR